MDPNSSPSAIPAPIWVGVISGPLWHLADASMMPSLVQFVLEHADSEPNTRSTLTALLSALHRHYELGGAVDDGHHRMLAVDLAREMSKHSFCPSEPLVASLLPFLEQFDCQGGDGDALPRDADNNVPCPLSSMPALKQLGMSLFRCAEVFSQAKAASSSLLGGATTSSSDTSGSSGLPPGSPFAALPPFLLQFLSDVLLPLCARLGKDIAETKYFKRTKVSLLLASRDSSTIDSSNKEEHDCNCVDLDLEVAFAAEIKELMAAGKPILLPAAAQEALELSSSPSVAAANNTGKPVAAVSSPGSQQSSSTGPSPPDALRRATRPPSSSSSGSCLSSGPLVSASTNTRLFASFKDSDACSEDGEDGEEGDEPERCATFSLDAPLSSTGSGAGAMPSASGAAADLTPATMTMTMTMTMAMLMHHPPPPARFQQHTSFFSPSEEEEQEHQQAQQQQHEQHQQGLQDDKSAATTTTAKQQASVPVASAVPLLPRPKASPPPSSLPHSNSAGPSSSNLVALAVPGLSISLPPPLPPASPLAPPVSSVAAASSFGGSSSSFAALALPPAVVAGTPSASALARSPSTAGATAANAAINSGRASVDQHLHPGATAAAIGGNRSPVLERVRKQSLDVAKEPPTMPSWMITSIRNLAAAAASSSSSSCTSAAAATGVVSPGSGPGSGSPSGGMPGAPFEFMTPAALVAIASGSMTASGSASSSAALTARSVHTLRSGRNTPSALLQQQQAPQQAPQQHQQPAASPAALTVVISTGQDGLSYLPVAAGRSSLFSPLESINAAAANTTTRSLPPSLPASRQVSAASPVTGRDGDGDEEGETSLDGASRQHVGTGTAGADDGEDAEIMAALGQQQQQPQQQRLQSSAAASFLIKPRGAGPRLSASSSASSGGSTGRRGSSLVPPGASLSASASARLHSSSFGSPFAASRSSCSTPLSLASGIPGIGQSLAVTTERRLRTSSTGSLLVDSKRRLSAVSVGSGLVERPTMPTLPLGSLSRSSSVMLTSSSSPSGATSAKSTGGVTSRHGRYWAEGSGPDRLGLSKLRPWLLANAHALTTTAPLVAGGGGGSVSIGSSSPHHAKTGSSPSRGLGLGLGVGAGGRMRANSENNLAMPHSWSASPVGRGRGGAANTARGPLARAAAANATGSTRSSGGGSPLAHALLTKKISAMAGPDASSSASSSSWSLRGDDGGSNGSAGSGSGSGRGSGSAVLNTRSRSGSLLGAAPPPRVARVLVPALPSGASSTLFDKDESPLPAALSAVSNSRRNSIVSAAGGVLPSCASSASSSARSSPALLRVRQQEKEQQSLLHLSRQQFLSPLSGGVATPAGLSPGSPPSVGGQLFSPPSLSGRSPSTIQAIGSASTPDFLLDRPPLSLVMLQSPALAAHLESAMGAGGGIGLSPLQKNGVAPISGRGGLAGRSRKSYCEEAENKLQLPLSKLLLTFDQLLTLIKKLGLKDAAGNKPSQAHLWALFSRYAARAVPAAPSMTSSSSSSNNLTEDKRCGERDVLGIDMKGVKAALSFFSVSSPALA